jgi:oxygen-independent coproporphyrinogen-3 oxidase
MADQYEALIARLHAAGCEHYELTNYCKPGYHSLHNSAYWERRPYLGIGCGAHSFDGRRRFWNRRDTRAHLAVVESGEPIAEGEEILNGEMVEEESVYLGLRTRNGICGELTRELCSTSAVESLVREGYLEWVDDRLRVVEEKWLMLDDIVLRVMKQ